MSQSPRIPKERVTGRTLKYISFPRPSGGGLSQKTVNVKMLLCAPVRAKDDGKICSIVCVGAGDEANPGLVGGKWGLGRFGKGTDLRPSVPTVPQRDAMTLALLTSV